MDLDNLASPPQLPDVTVGNYKISRQKFKEQIGRIAVEFNNGKIKDPVLDSDFESREENFKAAQRKQVEFQKFQDEYVTKLRVFSAEIMKIHGAIESDEVKIYKRWQKINDGAGKDSK